MAPVKTFAVTRTYDVSPGRLLDVLLDPAFLAEKAQRFGGAGAPTVQRGAGTATVEMPRQLPMDQIPSAARSFVPAGGRVVQKESWLLGDTGAEASWEVDTGSPASVRGTHRVTAAGTGSWHEIAGAAKVGVPFVGGRLEGLIAEHLEKLCQAEADFAAEWLARG